MTSRAEKIKILFLCTGNACRSQMAEGWARHLKSDFIDPYSAGVSPHGVDRRAVEVMREAGVDISGQESKHIDTLEHIEFDYVITLCDNAEQSCPVLPARTRVLHVGFDDPPKLALLARSDEEALNAYRQVRDKIRAFIETLPRSLQE